MTTFDSTKLFFDMWVKHHEMPKFIINDKETKFMMGSWKHLIQKVGTKLSFSMTFHPQISMANRKGQWGMLNCGIQ